MSKAMKTWVEISGDINWEQYGSAWVKPYGNKGRYMALKFENMDDICREGEFEEPFMCEVLLVSPNEVNSQEIKSAVNFCGMDGEELITELELVSCLVSSGTFAVLDCVQAKSYPLRVRAQARRIAEKYIKDEEKIKKELEKPCNKIGTTKGEAMRGDILAGLCRSAEKVVRGENIGTSTSIILKMYGATNGQTLGGEVHEGLASAGNTPQDENK